MARRTLPLIKWGAGLVNTLNIGYPLDNAAPYCQPRDGSEWAQGTSGVRDSWITGTDELLAGDVRWIPTVDSAAPLATGWDGATGWRSFLIWARDSNVFEFYPDRDGLVAIDARLIEPMNGAPAIEDDGTRRIRLVIESADGTAFEGY